MSRRTFHSSHSDSALSAVGAETNEEDDCPAKFSSDSESEGAQPSTKPLKVKDQSAAQQLTGYNCTWKRKVHNR